MKVVLSIAGSDPSGGAGIQADIKTITAHQLYAETVVTALTAQNTLGVFGVEDVSPPFVALQLDTVYDDIRPDAVKIGMVSSVDIIRILEKHLIAHNVHNIVVDPVMVSTSGGKLIHGDAIEALKACLFPLADVVTPNLPEAEMICETVIANEEDQENAAKAIANLYNTAALVKGGHSEESGANDVLATTDGKVVWLRGDRINTKNTHGTGCTLSSAIACNLALGFDIESASRKAKSYITGALAHELCLGKGNGPLSHMWEY